MKPDHLKNSLAVIMPLMFAVACGGGSGSGAPVSGEANAGSSAAEQSITGRVADGYLQGAIVCIDINENDQCDPDEPQVESGEGGSYSLDVPAGAAGKPVIAEVPATAIDEDTGLPIGKELVLSTPGDKPEFVSPITTLVHQELKNNPNLNTEDAAAAVLETLGLPNEEDSTLFTDYVANSDDADQEKSEKFEFLHQTARVVASMMDEIHADVEDAANAQGIDVESAATAAAIHDLVREEIRAQLPNISAAVADRILQIEAAQTGDGQQVELTDEFDPDTIAGDMGDRDLTTDIAEKIEAAKDEAPVERAKMDELLASGIYIIDVDCERLDEHGADDGLVALAIDQPAVMFNDEGVPEVVAMPEYCSAEYTHVVTEALTENTANIGFDDASSVDGDVPAAANLSITHYYYGFDETTGSDGWIMEEESREDRPHLLTLVNGDWVPVEHEGPYGVVEFTADGAAVMNTDEGKLLVYASSRDLSGKSVLHHVLNRGANDSLASIVDESNSFPDGASVHQLHIKRNASLIAMFNWYPEENDSGVDSCADFGGNCNVVYVKEGADLVPMPLSSLGELYDGAVIDAVAYDNREHLPVDLALYIKTTEETTTSKITGDAGTVLNDKPSGVASWTVSLSSSGIKPYPAIDPYPGGESPEPHECVDDPVYNADGTEFIYTNAVGDEIPYCPKPVIEVPMVCLDSNLDYATVMVPEEYAEYAADAQDATQKQEGILPTGEEVVVPNCPLPPRGGSTDVAQSDVAIEIEVPVTNPDGTVVERPQKLVIGESRWYAASVDGVDMIVVEVPVGVRHRLDEDEMAELLLIQNGEFVRRGARIGERSVDDETAYSAAAFDTLLPVIVDYVTPSSLESDF